MIQKDTIKVKENDGQRKRNGTIFRIFAVNRSRFFPVLLAVRRSLGPSSRPQPIMASAQGSRGSPPPWPREVGCPLSLPALLRYSLFPPWNLWLLSVPSHSVCELSVTEVWLDGDFGKSPFLCEGDTARDLNSSKMYCLVAIADRFVS